MRFECPWPKGEHREEHFPCGVKYINIHIDEHIHSYVPGHILINYLRWKKAMFELKEVPMPKCGREVRELLIEALRNWKWGKLHHRHQIETCINCPRANWDYLCKKVKGRLKALD